MPNPELPQRVPLYFALLLATQVRAKSSAKASAASAEEGEQAQPLKAWSHRSEEAPKASSSRASPKPRAKAKAKAKTTAKPKAKGKAKGRAKGKAKGKARPCGPDSSKNSAEGEESEVPGDEQVGAARLYRESLKSRAHGG